MNIVTLICIESNTTIDTALNSAGELLVFYNKETIKPDMAKIYKRVNRRGTTPPVYEWLVYRAWQVWNAGECARECEGKSMVLETFGNTTFHYTFKYNKIQ